MTIRRTAAIAATLALLAGCGDPPRADQSNARDAHRAASAAMDASFDKELGGGAATPAKPAEKPVAKPAAAPKPKPGADAPAGAPAVEHGRPAWVDQPPSEDGKLFAVGGAPHGQREAAQNNARKELAKQLHAHVKGSDTSVDFESTKYGAGGQRVGEAWSTYRSEATVSVDRDLNATAIVAVAEDNRETWALASLDCVAWAAQLRQDIARVDAKLAVERDRVNAAGSGLRQAAQALRAVGPLAARREALESDLILADPKGTIAPSPVDVAALLQACAKQLSAISVRLEGSPDAVFAARAQDAMARVGLTVTEKSGSAIGVRLALRVTPRELPNKWTRVNVAGSATVVDPASGAVAGSLQIDESATDPDANQAHAKMLDKASDALAKAINERLIELLAGGG